MSLNTRHGNAGRATVENEPVPATSRRIFVAQLAALGTLLPRSGKALAHELLAEPRDASALAQEPMPTRPIPATGEPLPIVGFGSSKAVLDIPTAGTSPIEAVLRILLDRGGRVVDTSPRSEAIDAEFGRILQLPELRERLFIATKINADGGPAGTLQVRQMQRLFGRPQLDLVQIESMRDIDAHWHIVRALKDTGETRYIGVTVSSNAMHERMEAFMRAESFDFAHVNYSVVETGAEDRLLPLARDRGMAVLLNRPFMNGEFFRRVEGRALPAWATDFDCTTWAQFSLKYVLAHPAVTCVFTETTNPEHMRENTQAAFGRLPDEAARRRMRDLARTL
jgi:diketogulonate reductase-like aldo/keto reductase